MDPYGQSQTSCPQCGAPAPFRGTAVSLVCEFCDSTIVRTGIDVRLIGKVSALIDNGSPIILGSRGRHRGTPFEVAGRLQVSYGRGTWNEWFVDFADGTTGWLTDAQGQYAIVRPKDPSIVAGRVPAFNEIQVNMILNVDGIEAVVVDRRGASYKGAEGILPFEAQPGMTFYGVDLRGHDGEFLSLDYGNAPGHAQPTPYLGEAIELAAVGLHPLRQFEGWRFTGWNGPGPQGQAQPGRSR
ncbi:DUF4178 domain-containing protein [Paraliomyxa miuraensis]|uniref:DUF4178 domain-containing protein n=1 Tax=Paraliomyxa miuraensis TaxID=376150 RepID=UPI00224E2DC8|nr:DUF4178 domain-containing protein [Paraliomyxa miuraensis]MCX4243577.1 DUF4178 domain-containing protein [Paraliomyxa miuraensis]